MLKALSKETLNKQLGEEVKVWLVKNNLAGDARVFFNGSMYEWSVTESEWTKSEGIISDYCPYSVEDTVGMTFEGILYDLIHYYPKPHPILEGLDRTFEKYGYSYKLGNTWSLTAVTISGD